MFADIQAAEIVAVATEQPVRYDFIQDVELVHVGGGCGWAHF